MSSIGEDVKGGAVTGLVVGCTMSVMSCAAVFDGS